MEEPARPRIDLHTHSTASDGLLAPGDLVRAARDAGLDVLALTDHDSTGGLPAALEAGALLGIEVIPGVELNTSLPGVADEVHVLGYLMRWTDETFQARLADRRLARERRGQAMVRRLHAHGIPITWEAVKAHAHGAVGRPHIAEALMDLGLVASVADAFDRYLSRGQIGYVPREPFSPAEAIALIVSVGGVPVLAHPAGFADLDRFVADLAAHGLRGLETYYGTYDAATEQRLLAVCQRFDLIPTGGSDYHGPGIHPTPLGGRFVPPQTLDRLRLAARASGGLVDD
jgi:predicted metal-dependent phosphoesterase TrpH